MNEIMALIQSGAPFFTTPAGETIAVSVLVAMLLALKQLRASQYRAQLRQDGERAEYYGKGVNTLNKELYDLTGQDWFRPHNSVNDMRDAFVERQDGGGKWK